jgi:hypothetical protein
VTTIQPTLLALLREIARAERDGLDYRASPGDAAIRELVDAGLVEVLWQPGRPGVRRHVCVVTTAGRQVVGEFVG